MAFKVFLGFMGRIIKPERYFGWDQAEERLGRGIIKKPGLTGKPNKKIYWLLIGLIAIALLFFFLTRL